MAFNITVAHDEGVWYVQSSDIPGLNAEAPTLDTLVEVITDLAPDLITANVPGAIPDKTGAFPLRLSMSSMLESPRNEWGPTFILNWFDCYAGRAASSSAKARDRMKSGTAQSPSDPSAFPETRRRSTPRTTR
jgi:hypothetical protein